MTELAGGGAEGGGAREEPLGSAGRERGPARRAPRGRRRGRRLAVALVVRLAVLALVFLVGLVVGRALEDAPRPGGEQTLVRTLVPGTLGPVEQVTVTVGER